MRKFFLSISLTLLLLASPVISWADEDPAPEVVIWQQLPTNKFIIVYAVSITQDNQTKPCPFCGVAEAERYAKFIDGLYSDLAKVFKVELKTPVNLRLFPTEQSYFVVNPLAEYLTGVIAHSLNSREEVAVALPRTEKLTDDDLVNNMRHEFTHLFASQLSDGNLTAGFQEGVAQYLEKNSYQQAAYDPAVLKLAFEQKRLLTWAELDQARETYSDPQVAYPQSLAVVSFLVDRYGFPKLIEFLQAIATETGYRTALQKVYDTSAEELEREWLNYLPSYFESRWKINAVYNYDLGRVTDLVNRGAYSDGKTELTDIITLLETTNQTETLAQAKALLSRATAGQQAAILADESRAALLAGNYDLTITKGQAAVAAYNRVGFHGRIGEIETYLSRAQMGQEAWLQLEHGRYLMEYWRFFEAEEQLYEATIRLQALNDSAGVAEGLVLLQEATNRQSYLAYFLLSVGGALFLLNWLHRLITRLTAPPLEVEFQ